MANELFVALAKAQAQFPTIVKNRTNYNKGKYADLTAILDAVKPALSEQGVIIIQSPVTRVLESGVFVVDIITTLAHGASGQTYEGILSMPTKADAQSIGSAITYGRRYALVSMLALSADDDDDGEEATKPAGKQAQRQAPPSPPAESNGRNGNGNGHKAPTTQEEVEYQVAHNMRYGNALTDEVPNVEMISKAQLSALHAAGNDLYGKEWDSKRPALVSGATKRRAEMAEVAPWTSASDLTRQEADTLIQGIRSRIVKAAAAVQTAPEPAEEPENPFTDEAQPEEAVTA